MISSSDILKASILIVDDQEANVSLLEQMLRGAGYVSVTSTRNPHEVFELHRQNRYSLILLDLQMPGLDGFQVMEGLKAIETDGYLPVLVLTAQPDHKLRALKAGAKDFLSKPFDLAEVVMRVHNMLEVRLLHAEAEMRTKQAENSERGMRVSELSYRRLFEAAQDGILILDVETGRITDVNPFLVKLLGFTHSEMVGKTVGELSPFKDIESNQAMLEQLQKDGYVRYENLPLETKDGRNIDVEFVSNVYQAGERNVIQCNIRDITEQHRMENALRESEAKFRTLFNEANDAIFMLHNGRFVESNSRGLELFGVTRDQLIGQSPSRFSPPTQPNGRDSEESAKEIVARVEAGKPQIFEWVHQRSDGSTFYVDVSLNQFELHGQPHLQAIVRDITERKKIEEQLLWKTAFFEAQVHSSLDGILVVDGQGNKILQNQRMADLWNIPREIAEDVDDRQQLEWVSRQVKNPRQFGEKVAYLQAHSDEISRDEIDLIDGKVFDRYSSPVRDKDGKCYGRIWSFRDITERKRTEEQIAEQAQLLDKARDAILVRDLEGKILFWNRGAERLYGWTSQEVVGRDKCELFNANRKRFEEANNLTISQGEWSGELHHLSKDRREITIEARWTLIRDNEGHPKSVLEINTDVTESKKIEAQFMRAQRMESIGTLAGGIAHDLNNILAPIMMSIDILKLTATDPQAMSILDTIEVSAKRGSDIVRQVLSFARGLEGQRIEVQPKHLLKDVENIIKDTFPKNIQMHFSIPNDTWMILGDPTQVHQILLNLCVNARDAMPNGGNLTISVENAVLDEQYAAMNIQAKAGRYVNISVTDSGTGMPPDLLDKIFEPFFTTKGVNEGTGLGLSTVMAIVKSHDGIVNVYSEPGKGTTFKIYLPAMEITSEGQREQLEQASPPRGNGETVLIVDDEASILTITSQTLRAFGYRVLTATDGAHAVAIYAEHKKEIAVVLTDMAMPIMDGLALIHSLMRINPTIKIIAASGLNANGGMSKGPGALVKHFLTKPYTAGTLLKTLRTLLDET